MSSFETMPTLDVRDEEVFLGEEVVFRAGLRCETRVDARELYGRACRLEVTAPDGRVTAHEREGSSYDGPSTIRSLCHRECLNDLGAPLVVGDYELRYVCEGREARRRITVRPAGEPAPLVAFRFPERIDVEASFAVSVEVANAASAPLCVVEPNACYAASVVGFVFAAEPRSWSRLTWIQEPEQARRAESRTTIEAANRGAPGTIALAPGERRRYEVAFESALGGLDAEWRPRERFDVTVGLVLHAFDPRIERPARWLRRARGDFLVSGVLQSVGEARCRNVDWVRVSPSGW